MPFADFRHSPFVLLDDNRPLCEPNRSMLFYDAEHIIEINSISEVSEALIKLDQLTTEGYYLAGWIAYECAYALEEKLQPPLYSNKAREPLIWMMATKNRKILSPGQVEAFLHVSERGNLRQANISTPELKVTKNEYTAAINQIKNYILSGDVYQVNYTMPVSFTLSGDPLALYRDLRNSQPVTYGAYINTGSHQILSRSPELFIEKNRKTLTAKPMKGTAQRGLSCTDDISRAHTLHTDTKSRAENLMIVDLLRNDLSRIADAGSVKVEKLFDIETYLTLHQMTSTISASSHNALKVSDMLRAIFPCGSITGAPKIRAMEIIAEIEKEARGVYCGAIGYISPSYNSLMDKKKPSELDWTFNVPIRTLVIENSDVDKYNGIPNYKGRFHIGSGIIADSNSTDEYAECLLKANFITFPRSNHSLIETFRLHNGEYLFKSAHLDRMAESAAYFGYVYDRTLIDQQLSEHCLSLKCDTHDYRVRLLLDRYGSASITSTVINHQSVITSISALADMPQIKTLPSVIFAKQTVHSKDTYLFHKTTNRAQYNGGYRNALNEGHIDMIYTNESGHVTEGAIHNIFLHLYGEWITPTQSSGLLDGVLRRHLLDTNQVTEKTIYLDDVLAANKIALGNSVRGLSLVTLEHSNKI
jgi:para-aminobenzoate synthetase/4-amino-4-deoxychorismate lyase